MISVTPLATVTSPVLGWLLLMLAAAAVLGSNRIKAPPRWFWWLVLAGALLAFRWPLLWAPHQQNPDESQLIAGAITLRHDPVFWRSVDGVTAGPLDYYPLLPAAWGDGVASYAIARLIGLATVFGTIVFAGETLALLFGLTVARAAVVPALAFHALTTHPDFAHYSTELMPALLLAAAGWLMVRQDRRPAPTRLWLIALLLGATPWAKPQAFPLAGLLWLLAAVQTVRTRPRPSLAPLVVGALVPAVACFALVAATGQTEHLVTPFFLNNFFYVNANAASFTWAEAARLQWQNALLDGYLGLWLAGATGFTLYALARIRRAPATTRRLAALAALLLAVGIVCALGPRRPSAHHLHFLMLPLVWSTGAALALVVRYTVTPRLLAAAFLLCTLAPQLAWRATNRDAAALREPASAAAQRPPPAARPSRRALKASTRSAAGRRVSRAAEPAPERPTGRERQSRGHGRLREPVQKPPARLGPPDRPEFARIARDPHRHEVADARHVLRPWQTSIDHHLVPRKHDRVRYHPSRFLRTYPARPRHPKIGPRRPNR